MTSRAHNDLFKKGLEVGYKLGLSSIRWDPRENRVMYHQSVPRFIWICVQLTLVLCYQAFLLYKCWVASVDASVSPRNRINIRYVAFAYIMLNCNHVIAVFKGKQFVQLLNDFRYLVIQKLGEGKLVLINLPNKFPQKM